MIGIIEKQPSKKLPDKAISPVIHLHGELKVTSSYDRLNPNCIMEYPLDVPIRMGDKAADGSQLRSYIVWFGESLGPEIEQAVIIIENADKQGTNCD